MNKHEKKMLAEITADNDAGKPCRGPGHYTAEYAALDKLAAAGTIVLVPETKATAYGYVIAGHPLTRDPKFNLSLCLALSDATNRMHQAERDMRAFEKLLGRS